MSKNLDYTLAFYGHNTDLKNLQVSKKIIDTIFEISKIMFNNEEVLKIKEVKKDDIIKNAKIFFEDKFRLHNIGYLPDDELKEILDCEYIDEINDLIYLYNNSAMSISPFQLPIKYDKNTYGVLKIQTIEMEGRKLKEIYSKLKVFYQSIILPDRENDITVTSYVHEITHTQLDKGTIKDYNNTELLSIFMELLYGSLSDTNTYNEILRIRFNYLIACLRRIIDYQSKKKGKDKDLYYSDIKYFISTFKAFNLMEKYLNGNDNRKKEILESIQSVFDEEYILEYMLEKMDINNDNIYDSEHIKRIML